MSSGIMLPPVSIFHITDREAAEIHASVDRVLRLTSAALHPKTTQSRPQVRGLLIECQAQLAVLSTR